MQTCLTTVRWDVPEHLLSSGYPLLVDAGPDETLQDANGVRLLAYYTPQQSQGPTKGAVLLLHGWEGCSHSNYNLVAMRELAAAGYDVFRLNLRDHGPGYHVNPVALNPGVFLGTLLAETVHAIATCAQMVEPLPVYLVGFSMGGTFALRAAAYDGRVKIPNLERVIAVNPAINPHWSTARLDANLFLRRYFREPWLSQIRQKQRFYPSRYDFEPVESIASLIEMTTWLVRYLGRYENAEEYFAAYSFLGDATRSLNVSTLIITSLDDLVVPVADFYGLAPHPQLKIDIHRHGGHVGYVGGWPPQHMVGELIRSGIESSA